MARIQISIPESAPLATLKIPVRITDINYGNHLGNDSVVSIIHEARMQFLMQHRFTELNAGGISLIMSDLSVQFKSESYYGDMLTVQVFASDISKVSFQLVYVITTMRNDKMVTIAVATTTLVGYNYESKKVIPLAQKLIDILKK